MGDQVVNGYFLAALAGIIVIEGIESAGVLLNLRAPRTRRCSSE